MIKQEFFFSFHSISIELFYIKNEMNISWMTWVILSLGWLSSGGTGTDAGCYSKLLPTWILHDTLQTGSEYGYWCIRKLIINITWHATLPPPLHPPTHCPYQNLKYWKYQCRCKPVCVYSTLEIHSSVSRFLKGLGLELSMVWGEPLNGEAIWIVNLRFTILQWVLVGHKTCLFSVFFFTMEALSGRQESNTIVTRSILFSRPIY